MPSIKTEPGDRLVVYAKHDGKRRGVIVHAAVLGKGRVEVVKARKS
jgi:hypothetical protein